MEVINYDYYFNQYNPLLHKFASKYSNVVNSTIYDYDDLYSISSVGLVLALQTYDKDRGKALLSHIYQTIQNEIYRQTLGNSNKEIQNSKMNNAAESIYQKANKEIDDVLVVDTISDKFSYEEVDAEIDLKREYQKVRKIMSEVLEFEEEVILEELYYYNKSLPEVAAKFNSTEKQMMTRKRMILKKVREVPYIKEIRRKIIEEKIEEIDEVDSIKAFFKKEGLLSQLEE